MIARTIGATVAALGMLGACAALVAGADASATSPTAHAVSAAGAQRLHTVSFGNVAFDVPADWHVSSTGEPGCIVSDSATPVPARERPYGIDDCQLRLITDPQSPFDADDLFFPGDPVVCHTAGGSVRWATTDAQAARFGAATAEYRRFTLPCVSRPAEQWFLGGPPVVMVQRLHMDPATEAAARSAVASARVPARRIGYPGSYTGLPSYATAGTVDLAPVRLLRDGHGSSSFEMARGQSLEADLGTAQITYIDAEHDPNELTQRQFLNYVRHGFPGVDDGFAVVVTISSAGTGGVDTVVASVAAQPN